MDPALIREREAFKKRALATPVVENKRKDVPTEILPKKKSKSNTTSATKSKPSEPLNYKTMTGSSQYNFSVLTKIVKHMKQRHLDGDTHPLTLEEILDETNQLDIGSRQRHWLSTEALNNNPKIIVSSDGRYSFKPAYGLRDRKTLMRLLDRHDQRGMGGIMLDDIIESLPNAEKNLKILGDQIIYINRPIDKKKVLFYNDKSLQFSVDEEFHKLWRSVAVDGIDDQKIEEYLEKQGISSMQDLGRKATIQKRKKPTSRKGKNFKKHNEHLTDILKDYSEG